MPQVQNIPRTELGDKIKEVKRQSGKGAASGVKGRGQQRVQGLQPCMAAQGDSAAWLVATVSGCPVAAWAWGAWNLDYHMSSHFSPTVYLIYSSNQIRR